MQPLLPMLEPVAKLIGKSFDYKVNCFSISEFFYRDTVLQHLTADEMLNFVTENFQQIENDVPLALTLIWSRTSSEVPIGEIRVNELAKRPSGFPFGLILEHSFVRINNQSVFQKADPTMISKVEIIPLSKAIEPYAKLSGFEMTHHKCFHSRKI